MLYTTIPSFALGFLFVSLLVICYIFVIYMCVVCYIYLSYIFSLLALGFCVLLFCVINMNHVFHLAHYKMHVRRSLLGIGQCRELECIGALKRRRGS